MSEKPITPDEFQQLATTDRIGLIDRATAELMQIGTDFALAAHAYYRDGGRNASKDVSAEFHRLDVLFDVKKHVLSSLQSTLRSERELSR